MPFRSEDQRRWMWANKPKMARKWTDEHGSKPVKAGEELYTNYGYKHDAQDEDANFPWYWELKRNMDKEERLEDKQSTVT